MGLGCEGDSEPVCVQDPVAITRRNLDDELGVRGVVDLSLSRLEEATEPLGRSQSISSYRLPRVAPRTSAKLTQLDLAEFYRQVPTGH